MTVKKLYKAMECVANAQTFLRETRNVEALREVERLDERLHAIAALRESLTGGKR